MQWRLPRAAGDGEVRFFGEIGSDMASVRRFVRKVEQPDRRLRFCYEAGPTGYGLQRLIEALGHECAVIAPSLIPRRPGERVKTNRRDAVKAGPSVPGRRADRDLDAGRSP